MARLLASPARRLLDVAGSLAAPLDRIAGPSLAGHGAFALHRRRTIEKRIGRFIASQAEPPGSPDTPMVNVLPLNHAQGEFALPAPIDKGRIVAL